MHRSSKIAPKESIPNGKTLKSMLRGKLLKLKMRNIKWRPKGKVRWKRLTEASASTFFVSLACEMEPSRD